MKIPLFKNTATSYLGMAIRLIQGILVTRWLIQDLGEDHYGVWVMLWSFFCCSLFLDFGLGLAAQRATATLMWQKELEKYNRIIATVFSIHCAMAVLIVIATLIGAFMVRQLLNLTPEQPAEYYRQALLIFGVGAAAIFPLGVFSEILAGLQKLWLRNYINIAAKLIELGGVLIIFASGGGLLTLILFSLGLQAAMQLAMMTACFQGIPGFRVRLRPYPEVFSEIFNFSASACIIALARMVWERGSTMLISIFNGLPSVTVYQIGCRLPVLMLQLTGPYQENIAPLSALLHSHKRNSHLASILLNSMRWNGFLATGLTVGVWVFAPELIQFLFGVCKPDITLICQYTALSVWCWLVWRTIPEKFLLMTDEHRLLTWCYTGESILFVLSTLVVFAFTTVHGEITVMVTSILSRLITTFGWIVPRMLKNTHLTPARLLKALVWQQLPPAAMALTVALGCKYGLAPLRLHDFPMLCIGGGGSAIAYLATAWFFCATPQERKRCLKKFLPQRNA